MAVPIGAVGSMVSKVAMGRKRALLQDAFGRCHFHLRVRQQTGAMVMRLRSSTKGASGEPCSLWSMREAVKLYAVPDPKRPVGREAQQCVRCQSQD